MSFCVNIKGKGCLHFRETITGQEVLESLGLSPKDEIVAWRVNGYLRSLHWTLDDNAEVELVDTTSREGLNVYRRTLSLLLIFASRKVLGKDVDIRHSLSKAYFCEIPSEEITPSQVEAIKNFMGDLIRRNVPIRREVHSLDRAVKIFLSQENEDKAKLLRWAVQDPVELYRCDGTYGLFYAPLAPSTGYVPVFDLISQDGGMVLQFPTEEFPQSLPPYQSAPKLLSVFKEFRSWLDILGVSTMANLHEKIAEGKALELMLVSEAFHDQRLNRIAEEIVRRESVRLVSLAGPSASGKTTTSRRLSVLLQSMGFNPVTISMDDYFVNRENTPRDEKGEYNFECLEALDVALINEHLEGLLRGEEVQLPRFNFITGQRGKGRLLRLGERDMIIIEGIHGLNERITESVPDEKKFGIFVSPLTGVCLDRHNRTSTTDNRFFRRLVRDYRTRGKTSETTILQWPGVNRGAFEYIYPYQCRADAMFNTALVYELPVLKGYAEPLLRRIPETSPAFGEAQRMLAMLRFVPVIPSDYVPNTSILREFIGGSCFGD